MRIKKVTQYCANGDYPSVDCNSKFKVGDVVINKDNEIGVIIQIHGIGEYRTDMFGNCCDDEIKLATDEEIVKFRPNIRTEEVGDKFLDLTIREVILEFRSDSCDEPLDGDEVDSLIEIIRAKINLHEGNITEDEYNELLG